MKWIVRDFTGGWYVSILGNRQQDVDGVPDQNLATTFSDYEQAVVARRRYIMYSGTLVDKSNLRILKLKEKPKCPTCGRKV